VEIVTQLAAKDFSTKLEQLNKPANDVEVLRTIAALMGEIEGSRHDTYFILRVVGDQHLAHLAALVQALDGDASSFVLHGLDAFVGNPAVAGFYKDYLEALKGRAFTDAQRSTLAQTAQKYLDRVQCAVVSS
jgi:hypothetical protein